MAHVAPAHRWAHGPSSAIDYGMVTWLLHHIGVATRLWFLAHYDRAM